MPGLPELFGDDFIPSLGCQVRDGKYLPHIDPSEARGVSVPCFNPSGTNIVTCQDKRISSFLREVDGLGFDIAPSSSRRLPAQYIPIFDYRTVDLAYRSSCSVVGLTLSDILISPLLCVAGQYVVKTIRFCDAAVIRRLCSQKKVVLFLTGHDTLIETIWHQRDVCGFFYQLNKMGFWAVTGFNFSVFGGECPVAQHLNQKKSLVSSMLAEAAGICSIPHVYAVNDFHIAKYQRWLLKYPRVNLLAMNCQMQRSEPDLAQVVRAVQALLIVNERLHFILQGFPVSALGRLYDFRERIHLAESKPVKFGQMFQKVAAGNVTRPGQYPKQAYKELVLQNIAYRKWEVAQQLGTS